MNTYRSRCQDCICLVEGDNGVWVCDELNQKVEEVKDCPQGLELKEVGLTRIDPTLKQFSQHPCTHWEMRDDDEYCVFFGKPLFDPSLHCNPQCPAYDPWDCSLEELIYSQKIDALGAP